jgi:hypothetical protein
MTLPEQHLLRRRRQILDDETQDRYGVDAHDDGSAQPDSWIADFMARLAALVGKTGGKP